MRKEITIYSDGKLSNTLIKIDDYVINFVESLIIDIDENGKFIAIIDYKAHHSNLIHTKNLFSEELEDADFYKHNIDFYKGEKITLDSHGSVDTTEIYIEDKLQENVSSLYVHINRLSHSDKDNILVAYLGQFSNDKIVKIL